MSHRFLMCEPQYFKLNCGINPAINQRTAGNLHQVGRSEANEQWTALHRLIQDSADVELISPEPNLPNMPFTANAGLVVGRHAIVSNFRNPERQTEEPHFERWFHDRGYSVYKLPRSIFFEGAGDALLDRSHCCIWMGHGQSSAPDAAAPLRQLLALEVVMLELVDPRFFHLDTCFCPLPRGYVMYYPGAFSEEAQRRIQEKVPADRLIVVGEEDAARLACNAVNIGDQVILNSASEALQEALTHAGFRVVRSCFSEFLRAGGASKCLVLRLEDPI